MPDTPKKENTADWPPYLSPVNLNGHSPESLRALIGGRDLYLRGAAFIGQNMVGSLRRLGFKVTAFLDKSPRLRGRVLQGLPVLSPDEIIGGPDSRKKIFVIMTSGYCENELAEELAQVGLKKEVDFISYGDLFPISPYVDISGVCNLRCQGCPRGNMDEHPPKGFMSARIYEQVLAKLLREMPFLGAVQLYSWGEPLLNKELNEIMALNKKHQVMSIISTNLSLKADLESFMAAGPELVRLSCSGYGVNYEITHTGGQWDLFLANAKTLARLKKEKSPETEIELYYHLYEHNRGQDYERIKKLAEELNFTFRPILASLYPRENIFLLREGKALSLAAQKQFSLLTKEVRDILAEKSFQESASDVCLDNRCCSINWNLNVRVCGVTYLPIVADNFLETPLTEIVRRMADSDTCRRCVKNRAHSFIKPIMADQRSILEKRGSTDVEH